MDEEEQSLLVARQMAIRKLEQEETVSALRVQGLRTSINQLKNLKTMIQVETKELKHELAIVHQERRTLGKRSKPVQPEEANLI